MADEPVAHYPNLTTRAGTFYLRMRVPIDLVPALGRTHVVRSLKTKERRVALSRYRTEQARAEREFETARQQQEALEGTRRLLASGRLEKLAPAEVEGLAIGWFEQAVQHVARSQAERAELVDLDWEAILDEVKAEGVLLASPNPDDYEQHVGGVADQILIAAGMPAERSAGGKLQRVVRRPQVDREVSQYQQLQALVRRGLLALNKLRVGSLTGSPSDSSDPIFGAPGTVPSTETRRTLEDLIRAFEADPSRTTRSGKTRADYAMLYGALREVIGANMLLESISREDMRRVQALFLALPPNATKRFPGRTLTQAGELAAKERLPVLRAKTVNEHVGKLATLFNWAVREEWLDRNPAIGLGIKTGHDKKDREPFSPEQLAAIFSAPIYVGCQDDESGYAKAGPNRPRRARFWVPLLSLFHGLRLNEACQLRPDDIAERDGVPVILVRAADSGQRIKSKAGTRIVPLHPEVIALGFHGFAAHARAAGQDRLFPELPRDVRGYYSDAFQKWFSRFLQSCGAAQENTTFHSFRHGWADRLREAGVPEDRRRALGGWANSGVDAGYGRGFPTKMLANDVAKVVYPGLLLSFLK
ncbi:site-specific integrase [Methylobacterium durans]|uniref:site-specific integrase n=1 Tax=Methylobacterium durans TaxID=2202825 RepID=UPI002AFF741F|nr:site-specific integrase [Methylobacterium durans]MEA1832165.1 site-specific integrase [Methylobacterium durans]